MEKKYSLKFVLALMLLASALTCLFTAALAISMFVFIRGGSGPLREYVTLLDMIDKLYIGEYDKNLLTTYSMKAAVESLGDRWSYYLTPEEYTEFLDDSNNRYAGIGVGVVYDEDGGICVDYVYQGSAAHTAGVEVGDLIIAIDGEDISGETIDGMRTRLSRLIGDTVDLTVMHPNGSIVTLTIVYSYVFIDPVSYEMLDIGIGYVSISNFDQGASNSFISAVKELIAQGAEAFIFDVRNNGGGRVVEMTGMLDYLLPEGDIFIAVDKSGMETVTQSDPEMVDLPCVVLVDCYSFSAAEYFAATLGEYGYASIVGEQTSGKSRMQTTYDMPGGGALHISTSQYLTKNRVSLHDVGGLTPDYEVVLTDEEFMLFISGSLDKEDDPQIRMALELLKT